MNGDSWGIDPHVRYMRKVFSSMEKAQRELLDDLGITLLDERLRRFREIALALFEKAWPVAMQRGLTRDEGDAASLYVHCLSRALASRGIQVPNDKLPDRERIAPLIKEILA
ncbi:MAG: hypothetical protein EHM36_15730 [Deltaproteobacteria bacterium]|nr:MAG: hypothetical protein EHM36_15730 [Deltaproteobacteria bacterium]